MGFLGAFRRGADQREIAGHGLSLRFPVMEDHDQWAKLRHGSSSFLKPWEPTWLDDELTAASFRHRIRRYRELTGEDLCYPYFIFRADELLGAVTLSNVRRGVAQTATLGYWIGEPHARQGHMSKALTLLLPHAHSVLNLHRVEAACLPRNTASIRLLERAGFEREGQARAYLKIAGRWEDHLLFGKVTA
jgi:ribosomal-protein-alanine N-acetyltransferase